MKKIFYTLFLAWWSLPIFAQLSVQVIVPNLPSRVSELLAQSDNIQILVTNTSATAQNFRVSGRVSINNAVIANILPSQSPVENIASGQVRTYNLNDLAVFQNSIDYQSPLVIDILRSGYLPAGQLNWCFTLHDANNVNLILSQEQCRASRVTSYQSPFALYPENGATMDASGLSMFRWSPITPAFPGALSYEILVYEIQPGQEAIQAMRVNQPIWQSRTPATQINWPFEVPKEAGRYIWIVQAFDSDGNRVGSSETSSEPRVFTITASTQASQQVNTQARVPELPYLQMQIKPRGSSQVLKTLIFKTNNMEAVQLLFEESDQKSRYEINLVPTSMVSSANAQMAQAVLNGKGDLVMVAFADGPVLSFKNNTINADRIGSKAGAMFIWRDTFSPSGMSVGKGRADLSLDRVRRLADNCKGLQGFLVFN